MTSVIARKVKDQIDKITGILIEKGITEKEMYSVLKDKGDGKTRVDIDEKYSTNIFLKKDIIYNDMYEEIYKYDAYNIKMLDGALIRFQYYFENEELQKSRLTFFPSPNLFAFDEEIELYQEDSIYADVISKNIFPVPIRFDYDKENQVEVEHPASHLTLGQYKNCRIPVTSPLTPFQFSDFIMRNFYNSFYQEKLQCDIDYNREDKLKFGNTIHHKEEELRHFKVYK